MKTKQSLKLVNEFDGMFAHSLIGMRSDNTTYCVSVSNTNGDYNRYYWHVYSNKPSYEFGFVNSFGILKSRGRGTIMPIMGKDTLYISESGWTSVARQEVGQPLFYALDLKGDIKWENKLDGGYALDVIEISNEYILVSYLLSGSSDEYYMSRLDKYGRNVWRLQLGRITVPPIVDNENNIFVKHGSKISKIKDSGQILWTIELYSDCEDGWNKVVCNNGKMYYGFQYNKEYFIMEFDGDGIVYGTHKIESKTSYPIIDIHTSILYCQMNGNILVAFDTKKKQIIYKTTFKKNFYSTPIIYNNYVIISYEKQVFVFTKDLILVASHRMKGNIKGANITTGRILQILTSDYQSWDTGKCDLCYSRVYELII